MTPKGEEKSQAGPRVKLLQGYTPTFGLYVDGLAGCARHESTFAHLTEKQVFPSMKAKWQEGISQQIRRHKTIFSILPWSLYAPASTPPFNVMLSRIFVFGHVLGGLVEDVGCFKSAGGFCCVVAGEVSSENTNK